MLKQAGRARACLRLIFPAGISANKFCYRFRLAASMLMRWRKLLN
jgi:hypothetical protein